jgi:hypothetical protein
LLKPSHFALVCRADAKLDLYPRHQFEFDAMRNLKTGRRLGYSQVTAVVEMLQGISSGRLPPYFVELVAEWQRPLVARLRDEVVLNAEELQTIDTTGASGSVDYRRHIIVELKSNFRSRPRTGADGNPRTDLAFSRDLADKWLTAKQLI